MKLYLLKHRFPLKTMGFSLVELLISLAIASVIIVALSGVLGSGLQVQASVQQRNDLTQQAHFAMQRMVTAVQGSNRLLLPLVDNPNSNWREHVREQYVPAQPPEGDSTLATAVLAVTLDHRLDTDSDGWSDANNDEDYLDVDQSGGRNGTEPERIDEDPWGDNNNDGAPGILGIDDNGDGSVDDSSASFGFPDDDEDDDYDEDSRDNIDNDGDSSIDEDMDRDENNDGWPGIAGVDDDLDGSIDEGDSYDDDEDGQSHEDSFDAVVYYLIGQQLIERWPSLVDTTGDAQVMGDDFTESVIAEPVSYFRVERIDGGRWQQIDLILELGESETVRLQTRVRVGGSL